MSSYLTFYIVPKEGEPLSLITYSRNSDVYQYFDDVIHPAYVGIEGETQYTELTVSKVDDVIKSLKNDINKTQKRILEYEKHANGDVEIIENIIETKEYVEDLEHALHKTEFIRDIVQEASYNWTSYDKVLCNID